MKKADKGMRQVTAIAVLCSNGEAADGEEGPRRFTRAVVFNQGEFPTRRVLEKFKGEFLFFILKIQNTVFDHVALSGLPTSRL